MTVQDILFIVTMVAIASLLVVIIADHFHHSEWHVRIGYVLVCIPLLSLIILPFTSLIN